MKEFIINAIFAICIVICLIIAIGYSIHYLTPEQLHYSYTVELVSPEGEVLESWLTTRTSYPKIYSRLNGTTYITTTKNNRIQAPVGWLLRIKEE